MQGIDIRLQSLLPEGEKAIVVAIDHGQTFGPMQGLVDFTAAAERLKEADGVLLAPQMVRFSGKLFYGRHSPVMIVRLNWNTVHCEPWEYREAHIVKAFSARAAVAVGAQVLMAGLVLKTDSERLDARNVQQFAELAQDTHDLGLPLIGEVFPAGNLREWPDRFHDYVVKGCRIACELGADAIKTFYTGERFAEVVEGTPIPVLALGAEKMENEADALQLAHKAVKAGAAGVVFGRNVVQAASPSMFLSGLKAVVQGQATPAEAAARYQLT
jgi:DhnA family fructose-bisphosphate aldolase class Ia